MLHLFDTYPIAPPAVPGSSGSSFIYQQPSYVSIVDGVAGWGHNTGAGFRPATGGAPNWYYVNDVAGTSTVLPSLVNSTYDGCTLRAAFEHNVNNKVIVILQSGSFDLTGSSFTELNLRGDNVSVIGFTVRSGTGYGLAIKVRTPIIIRGSHVYISGLRVFMDSGGSIPPYFAGDQRDIFQCWPGTHHIVIDRVEGYGPIDECADFSQCTGECSIVRSAVVKPNSNSGIHSVGHNYAVIGPYGAAGSSAAGTKFSMQRCAIFHSAARFPLSYSERTFLAHNLIYNISDGQGNNSQVIQLDRHPSDTGSAVDHSAIVAHCQLANGPQGYGNNWGITANNQQSGTRIYATGMRARGFNQISTADPQSFFGIEPGHDARQWRTTTIPTDALIDGVGASLQYLDALTDDLMLSTYLRTECGQHPKARGDTMLTDRFTEYENYINGTGSGYGSVGTNPTFASLTTFLIDRTNGAHVSAYWGGVSIPDHTTRNNIGSNGRSLGEDALRLIGAQSIGP